MTRKFLSLFLLMTLAVGGALNAEPTPKADQSPGRTAKNLESQRTQAKPAPALPEGWSYVNGEWVHSDGYKYVKGQVVRIGARIQKRPPKAPSKALLDSVKAKPTPSADPNSAAAKAAERARNLRPRPAPQTGSHL